MKQRFVGTGPVEVAQTGDTFTIVLGYDGSETARHGLSRVKEIGAGATKLVVVAVTPAAGCSALSPESLVGRDFDAERLLAEAAELLDGPGSPAVECRAASGDPAAVLVDVTRELNADLLIVGRRGSDFVARALLGSVAQRVVQQATCDVLVVA